MKQRKADSPPNIFHFSSKEVYSIFVIFVEGHLASGVARQGGFFLAFFSNFAVF